MGPAVDVWLADLDVPASEESRMWLLLDQAEQERAQQFRLDRLRRRYTVAHAMVRLLLGDRVQADPRVLRFETGEHGKPFLAGGAGLAGDPPHFNLSHSGERALVAIRDDGPVGVDIEQVRELSSLRGVAERILAPALLAAFEEAADPTVFVLDQWTRKEAVLKAGGEGITRPLREVDGSGCVALDVGEGYVGALAGPGRFEVVLKRWP
ncbi:MAG TPA: 4'-phosphopantetheinyl transferase superfamily protein [Acidimicrobiales bacterium]|jgi:4'-phosphopantetheinyl transferase|nr:4'-phosphopantetheinyl transferase superfamily protein [Acidimicrobiales bacterium]